MRGLLRLIGVSALLFTQPLIARAGDAAQPQVEEPATVLEDVDVFGGLSPMEWRRKIQRFATENLDPPTRKHLARWNRPVCIGAANFTPEMSRALIDHVAQRLVAVGGQVQEPDCKVNLMLIGTDDGAAMADNLVKDDPEGFRPGRYGTDRGADALQSFVGSDAAVRWWHVSATLVAETGEAAANIGYGPPTVRAYNASRIRSNVREDLMRTYVILDTTKLPRGVRMQALADYLAFVSLAQIDPDAPTDAFDSVLNLFERPSEVFGMTEFDHDFLAGLYSAPPNSMTVAAQGRAIASEIMISRR